MPLWSYLVPLTTVAIWSGNMIVNRMAAGTIAPGAIALYRLLLAVACMTPFLLPSALRYRRQIAAHWWKLAILGSLGMALWQGLAYFAALSSTATSMGIFIALVPLVTMLMSALILREPPGLGAVGGGMLAFAGMLVLIGRGDPGVIFSPGVGIGIGIGDGLMVIACLTYALYSVLLRRWQTGIPVWTAMYVQALFATLCLIPAFFAGPASPVTADNIGLILYAALAASIFSTYLWMKSVSLFGASRASIFMNLAPVLTAVLAIGFLGEKLEGFHLIGGGMALAGVILAQTITRPLPGLRGHQG